MIWILPVFRSFPSNSIISVCPNFSQESTDRLLKASHEQNHGAMVMLLFPENQSLWILFYLFFLPPILSAGRYLLEGKPDARPVGDSSCISQAAGAGKQKMHSSPSPSAVLNIKKHVCHAAGNPPGLREGASCTDMTVAKHLSVPVFTDRGGCSLPCLSCYWPRVVWGLLWAWRVFEVFLLMRVLELAREVRCPIPLTQNQLQISLWDWKLAMPCLGTGGLSNFSVFTTAISTNLH